MRAVLYIQNPLSGREYRVRDAMNVETFAQYGSDGSGWGYLSYRLPRIAGRDYQDLGYAFPICLRKGPYRVLFDGQVVRITESMDGIEVYALGWIHVALGDTFNRVYCDTRYGEWRTTEEPSGHLKPDHFDVDTTDRLWIEPRRGEADPTFLAIGDYGHLFYDFHFGEVATRFVADYDVALPYAFPAEVQILAGETVLWQSAATGAGHIDLVATGDATRFEVRFVITDDLYSVDAADDTVYAKFTNVKVYSLNVTTLDAYPIATDLVEHLAAHGLSEDTRLIEHPGRVLEPAAFDDDRTPADILTWCAGSGDANGGKVVWGVTFDDTRRLFVESADLTTVRYVINRRQAHVLERSGDWSESAQVAYGVYQDAAGVTQRTADVSDAAIIADLGGYYRRQAVDLSGVTDAARAAELLALFLKEQGRPGSAGSYEVAGYVRTPEGRRIPVDELVPGGLVQISEWRAIEAGLSTADYRDRKTTFLLAGVKVNHDTGVAELTPDQMNDAFSRQMETLQQLSRG